MKSKSPKGDSGRDRSPPLRGAARNPANAGANLGNMESTVMQAIVTTFKGPTNHQGARIVARFGDKRLTVPYDHANTCAINEQLAVIALAQRLTLPEGDWHRGQLNPRESVWVRANFRPKGMFGFWR